jgi:LacI family transcriptional regulator
MSSARRVVLIMSPGAGYERGVLRGIARYARHHDPWVLLLAGEQPKLPLPTMDTVKVRPAGARFRPHGRHRSLPLDLRGLGATGVIGRLYTPEIAEAVLASGLPVIAMDLTDEQLSKGSPLSRVSEIRPDSHKAGRLAAEHLLARGFQRFAFFGYPRENWSRRRQEGFSERLQEAGFGCEVCPLSSRVSVLIVGGKLGSKRLSGRGLPIFHRIKEQRSWKAAIGLPG